MTAVPDRRSAADATARAVTVELAANLDGDGHVDGSVRASGSEPVAFSGWLGLLEVLERFLDPGVDER